MAETSMVREERQISIEGENSHHLSLQTQSMGMWVFLMSEIMFFGAVFAAYILYRYAYPQEYSGRFTHIRKMGIVGAWKGSSNFWIPVFPRCGTIFL